SSTKGAPRLEQRALRYSRLPNFTQKPGGDHSPVTLGRYKRRHEVGVTNRRGALVMSNTGEAGMDDVRTLIEQEIPRMRRYARALLRNPVDADDLVQDTLLRALSKADLWE